MLFKAVLQFANQVWIGSSVTMKPACLPAGGSEYVMMGVEKSIQVW
jgi:hypothetical protein